MGMENCTDTGGSSLGHDLFVATVAVVGTCASIAAYNFYIDYQTRIKEEEAKGGKAKGEPRPSLRGDGEKKGYGTMTMTKEPAQMKLVSNALASSLAQIEGVEASGNFLSAIISQMWNHMNLAISKTLKDTLEPMTKELPVPVHFVKLDLGEVPIQTKNMFIHRVDLEHGIAGKKHTKPGIQIDMDVIWDGDCDIMLQGTLSRSAKVTFGVKNFKLSGRMHILLSPLTNELPIISSVQYGFTNPPDLQLSFSGAISILEKVGIITSRLPGIIQSAMAGVLVLPQRLNMPIDLGTYDYLDTYRAPVGMVRITPVEGRGFKVQRKMLLKDIPDVYVEISVGASKSSKTAVRYDNLHPSWKDETHDFILYDMDQKIYLKVWDKDKTGDADDKLGDGHITVRDIFRNNGRAEVELEKRGEKNGCFIAINAELFHLSERLHSLSSTKFNEKTHLCGLLTVIVTKAFDVPVPKEDAATHVKVVYGESSDHETTFYTGTVMDYPGYDALNPMYDCAFHIPLTPAMMKDDDSKKGKDKNNLTFTLIDTEGANGSKGHGELGKILVTHESLLKAYKNTITRTSPIGNNGAKLEYMISLSGMQSGEEFASNNSEENKEAARTEEEAALKDKQSLYGGMETRVSIRVTAVCGRGFKVRKRRLHKNDVPDVYCKISLDPARNHDKSWRTATIKDDTMPQWNDYRDFESVFPSKTTVCVDAYEDNKVKDEFLGSVRFSVEELLRKRVMEAELRRESGSTGTYVKFTCIELERESETGGRGVNSFDAEDEVLVHYHPNLGDEGFESSLLENKK